MVHDIAPYHVYYMVEIGVGKAGGYRVESRESLSYIKFVDSLWRMCFQFLFWKNNLYFHNLIYSDGDLQ